MNTIRFVIDAACDLTLKQVDEYGIVMCGAGIHINGKEYEEKKEISNEQFYAELARSKEIPTTSHVTPYTFQQVYTQAWKDGIKDIIHVTIHSGGSNTLGAAKLAAKTFFEESPEAEQEIRIHFVDSNTYSVGYGYPTLQAAKMARAGRSVEEILAYLDDWFDHVSIFFAVFTLEYIRKSGRISAAAALAGDLIGLKPIIQMVEGNSQILEKLRGEKKVLPRLSEMAKQNILPGGEYLIIKGETDEIAKQLADEITLAMGYPPVDICTVGPSIAINAGPKVVGVIYKGKARGHRAGLKA